MMSRVAVLAMVGLFGQAVAMQVEKGNGAALAETIAALQQRAFEDPAFGQAAMEEINAAGQHASFLRKTPEFNVKYEVPVSDEHGQPSVELSAVLRSLKGQHAQFLMENGSQYDRKTQAPMVWLHLNDASHGSFAQMPQAITDSVDLYIEQ